MCPQRNSIYRSTEDIGTEDCLRLNVYVPETVKSIAHFLVCSILTTNWFCHGNTERRSNIQTASAGVASSWFASIWHGTTVKLCARLSAWRRHHSGGGQLSHRCAWFFEHRGWKCTRQFRFQGSIDDIEMGPRKYRTIRWWSQQVIKCCYLYKISSQRNWNEPFSANVNRVTIGGCSAGSASTTYQMASPLSQGKP